MPPDQHNLFKFFLANQVAEFAEEFVSCTITQLIFQGHVKPQYQESLLKLLNSANEAKLINVVDGNRENLQTFVLAVETGDPGVIYINKNLQMHLTAFYYHIW